RPTASRARGRTRAARRYSPASFRGGSSGDGEALELEHLGARFLQRLRDGLPGVVDPRLVEEDLRREEPLAEHAVDDLLTCLFRLRLHLVGARVDLALGRDDLLGDVL